MGTLKKKFFSFFLLEVAKKVNRMPSEYTFRFEIKQFHDKAAHFTGSFWNFNFQFIYLAKSFNLRPL